MAGPEKFIPKLAEQLPLLGEDSEKEEISKTVGESVEGDNFEAIPGVTEENLETARRAVRRALSSIKRSKSIKKALEAKGIDATKFISGLRSTDFYVALAIKESTLKPTSESKSSAKGQFQIRKISLEDLHKKGLMKGVSMTDIYYDDPDSTSDWEIDTAHLYNAMAGILYWHICHDYYPKKYKLNIDNKDLDKAADFSYNLGPVGFARLWKELKPKNFEDFEKKIAEIVEKHSKKVVLAPNGKTDLFYPQLNVVYTYFLVGDIFHVEDKDIQIGKETYSIGKLSRSLRYVESIDALRKRKNPEFMTFRNTGDKELYPWSMAVSLRDEWAKRIPFLTEKTEHVRSSEKIWKIIYIIAKYNKEIGNPAFKDIDISSNEEVALDLQDKTRVYMPPLQYATSYIAPLIAQERAGKATKLIEEIQDKIPKIKQVPTLTEEIEEPGQLYCGKVYCGESKAEVKDLEKKGKKKLAFKGKLEKSKNKTEVKLGRTFRPCSNGHRKCPSRNRLTISKFALQGTLKEGGKKARLLRPIPDSLYKRKPTGNVSKKIYKTEKPKSITVHSTEGPYTGLLRGAIHFIVTTDGDIIETRHPEIPIDHAGRMDNVTSKAQWDGDRNFTLRSIGIEIETTSVTELVRRDKVDLPTPKNATIIEQKIGRKTYYYTTDQTPPDEQARLKAHKQTSKIREIKTKQYEALSLLIPYIGEKYGIRTDHVVAHSMIGVTGIGNRGRKSDPPNFDFKKVIETDNYKLLDTDAKRAVDGKRGGIGPHYKRIVGEMDGTYLERSRIDLSSPQKITMTEFDQNGKKTITKIEVKTHNTKPKNKGKRFERRQTIRTITIKRNGKTTTFKVIKENWKEKQRKRTISRSETVYKHDSKTISRKKMIDTIKDKYHFQIGELHHELMRDTNGDLNYIPYSFFGESPAKMLPGLKGSIQ